LQDKNKKAIVSIHESPIVEINELTPKHFDNLEIILHKMNQYHFRHVSEVSWRSLFFWIFCTFALHVFKVINVSGSSFVMGAGKILIFGCAVSFFCGLICIISKCLTRLYHFRSIAVRLMQSVFIFQFVDIFSPFLLILNKIHPNLEMIDSVLEITLCIGLLYFISYSFVPFKWLKSATKVYAVVALSLLLSLCYMDSFKHYILKDNELVVFSNFESGNDRDLASIDLMIDEITKE
jgi:hypothetical protein